MQYEPQIFQLHQEKNVCDFHAKNSMLIFGDRNTNQLLQEEQTLPNKGIILECLLHI